MRGEDMERKPRAHFGVYRINRLTLLILGLLLIAVATYRLNPVGQVSSIVDRLGQDRVASGVTLGGHLVAGMNEAELRAFLEALAPQYELQPIDAVVDTTYNRVVPDIAGQALDIERTVAHVMQLPENSQASLIMSTRPAQRTLDDYPDMAVWQGNPGKKAVSLAINVAWGEEHLPAMLDALAANGARTTFFLVGRWAERFPDDVRNIAAAGHELAIHGYDDRVQPSDLSPEQLAEDITKAARIVEEIAGTSGVRYFSPHLMEINRSIIETATNLGFRPVMYSLDTIDWQRPAPEVLVSRVLDNVENGDIILMHPTEPTAAALPAILAGLKQQGYQVVTISELLSPTPLGIAVQGTMSPPAQPVTNP